MLPFFYAKKIKKMRHHFIRIINICLLVITMFACTNKSIVKFGNDEEFQLSNNELQKKITKNVVYQYNQTINGIRSQIPLNKYISSKTYNIYIGIVSNSTMDSIVNNFKQLENPIKLYSIKKVKENYTLFYKNNDFFVYSTLFVSPKDKTMYIINYTTQDSLNASNAFNKNDILKRILI